MRLELTGRHVSITPALRRLVDSKLAKLERLLNDSAVSAQAVLTRERHRHRADITLHARGEKFLHGVGTTPSWERSVCEAIDKISQQAHKVKGKWQERKRHPAKAEGKSDGGPEGREADAGTRAPVATGIRALRAEANGAGRPRGRVRMPPVFRASRCSVITMSVGDAARQMNSGSEEILVFRDVETSEIHVLYRRSNGELSLVRTDT
jgi:putative sigma-54 modulation protein